MVLKFNDWLNIDSTDTKNVFEYMENYIDHYQDAFKMNLKRILRHL
jgi:hypothetical protein